MNYNVQVYNQLKNNLIKLKLNEIYTHLDTYNEYTIQKEKSFIEAMYELTNLELQAKEIRIMQSCVKTAGFPFIKTFDEFDFQFQPSINQDEIMEFKNMRFVDQAENIIFIGSPGVGKTHLSISIGIEAAKDHRSIRFVTCSDLIMKLKKAKAENRLEKELKFYKKYKVLIIDEVGFLPMDDEGASLFFQLISLRYEKNPTIITTNKPLSQWADIFTDPVITNAILDRLLHHSHIIKIVGRSYRTRLKQDEIQKIQQQK